jgi:SAM-dependent methyltransferase
MKPTGNPDLNSKTYWNSIYSNEQKRAEYEAQGTAQAQVGDMYIKPTTRFAEAVKWVADGDKFLDIGCGVGQMTELVYKTRKNVEVWGVDISDAVIASNSAKTPKIIYKQGYVGDLKDIPTNYFDSVFSGEVLEHLTIPKNLFLDAYRALKPGGKFILTTPYDHTIESEEHLWYFTPDDIEDLYRNNGFDPIEFIHLPHLEHLYVIMTVGIKK